MLLKTFELHGRTRGLVTQAKNPDGISPQLKGRHVFGPELVGSAAGKRNYGLRDGGRLEMLALGEKLASDLEVCGSSTTKLVSFREFVGPAQRIAMVRSVGCHSRSP